MSPKVLLWFMINIQVARTKTKKMIDFNIFCKSTGIETFTGANCDQIEPLVETLSSFKVGAH